jgi:hypothetical protein
VIGALAVVPAVAGACSSDSDGTSGTTVVSSTTSSPGGSRSTAPRTTTTLAPVTDRSIPTNPPPREPVVTARDTARNLRDTAGCDPLQPSSALVTLLWEPTREGAQLVAIAPRADGFDTGRYTVSDEFPPAASSYRVGSMEPGGVYYWRVLTRRGDEWAASPVRTVTAPICAVDRL